MGLARNVTHSRASYRGSVLDIELAYTGTWATRATVRRIAVITDNAVTLLEGLQRQSTVSSRTPSFNRQATNILSKMAHLDK